jgi:hypothetical protein
VTKLPKQHDDAPNRALDRRRRRLLAFHEPADLAVLGFTAGTLDGRDGGTRHHARSRENRLRLVRGMPLDGY